MRKNFETHLAGRIVWCLTEIRRIERLTDDVVRRQSEYAGYRYRKVYVVAHQEGEVELWIRCFVDSQARRALRRDASERRKTQRAIERVDRLARRVSAVDIVV